MIEMDTVATEAVIKPLGLPRSGQIHVELYKNRDKLEWINMLVTAVQQHVRHFLTDNRPVVFDGTIPNVLTIQQLLAGLPDPEIIYFHPSSPENYIQYLTQRFLTTDENNGGGLPLTFWKLIDDQEFHTFCQNRIVTPGIRQSIAAYADYSIQSSNERLAELNRHFKDIITVEI